MIPELIRRLDGDQLHIRHGEEHGDKARAHGGDLRADEVAEEEHDRAGGHARVAEVGNDILEALAAKSDGDHDEGNDHHAEHVDAAHHGGVERCGGNARVHQRRAAGDGGQARASPGAGRCVAQQSRRDGHHRVKAQRHEERSRDGRRRTGARGALQKDGDHHAHHDELHAPVAAGEVGHRAFHVVDGAGLFQRVEDHERAEYHKDDLAALLETLPHQRVIDRHVFLEGQAPHVEIRKGQRQRPQKRQRRHLHRRLFERQNAHQHKRDGTDGQCKLKHSHNRFSFSFADRK